MGWDGNSGFTRANKHILIVRCQRPFRVVAAVADHRAKHVIDGFRRPCMCTTAATGGKASRGELRGGVASAGRDRSSDLPPAAHTAFGRNVRGIVEPTTGL
jgi:hypothetical protein